MVYITAIHMAGGSRHEHVAEHWWLNPSTGKTGQASTAGMVDYIEDDEGEVRVGGPDGPIQVGVVHPSTGKPYLRTYADKTWTDNILSLPEY